LANQYLSQLVEITPSGKSTKIRDAIFGNVGTIVCFRVGAEDAEFLEKEFWPEFTSKDLVNLGKYNIYLKLMIDGLAGRPFSAETLPPLPRPEKSNREKIIKVSRERYGTQRKIIEEKIAKWIGLSKLPETAQPAPQVLYEAQCVLCGKRTKVIFSPDGKRPVYCKSCLKKTKSAAKESKETAPFTISLEKITESEFLPFSLPKKEKPKPEKPRKEVNVEELKKVLEKALKKVKKE
jgi:CxxC-x17-CxxC domain-containing protein